MKASEEKKYEHLSPFELKDKLIQMASSKNEKLMLNAGRGNPNWLATEPRMAFLQLGNFAIQESKKTGESDQLGGTPQQEEIAQRFETFLREKEGKPGIDFLKKAYYYATEKIQINDDEFVFEITDAILGDHYPTPDRMLTNCERVVQRYLEKEMFASQPPVGKINIFATEGGTAAMDYIFSTLLENNLLHKGDKIALGTPIFTPYIEIPRLNDYQLVELKIKQDEDNNWVYPEKEIEKLSDPQIKAFFLVNPSNPSSVSMSQESLNKITEIVKNKNQNLIILTDDVYGTFVNDFKSIAHAAPYNTILVYSYSKYFGCTGIRLGVIAIHENNVFDKRIAGFSENVTKQLYKRYESVVLNPNKMKLIDRMVADSRSVALNHTAGLSTPQQVMMVLFSLLSLTDNNNDYKKMVQSVVKRRFEILYKAIGIKVPNNPLGTHYYTIIDIPKLAAKRYDKHFADHMVETYEPIDFVMRLAEEKSVVLLNGGGFEAPDMSVRVSLANLSDKAYEKIGKAISDLLEEYYRTYKQ